MSTIRKALLKEFSPEDLSLVEDQLFKDAKQNHEQSGSNDNISMEVSATRRFSCTRLLDLTLPPLTIMQEPLFPLDDDVLDLVESASNQSPQLAMETPDLLNVDQILESVSLIAVHTLFVTKNHMMHQ